MDRIKPSSDDLDTFFHRSLRQLPDFGSGEKRKITNIFVQGSCTLTSTDLVMVEITFNAFASVQSCLICCWLDEDDDDTWMLVDGMLELVVRIFTGVCAQDFFFGCFLISTATLRSLFAVSMAFKQKTKKLSLKTSKRVNEVPVAEASQITQSALNAMSKTSIEFEEVMRTSDAECLRELSKYLQKNKSNLRIKLENVGAFLPSIKSMTKLKDFLESAIAKSCDLIHDSVITEFTSDETDEFDFEAFKSSISERIGNLEGQNTMTSWSRQTCLKMNRFLGYWQDAPMRIPAWFQTMLLCAYPHTPTNLFGMLPCAYPHMLTPAFMKHF